MFCADWSALRSRGHAKKWAVVVSVTTTKTDGTTEIILGSDYLLEVKAVRQL